MNTTGTSSVLHETRFGTYTFEAEGMEIHHPALSPCGRFPVSPADYGFSIVSTGVSSDAWERDFRLPDGTPVTMIVTQDAGATAELGRQVRVAVYADAYQRSISWLQYEGSLVDSPPIDIKRKDWV